MSSKQPKAQYKGLFNMVVEEGKLVVDVRLVVKFNEENRIENAEKTLHKTQKTLEILLKTDKDNQYNALK